MIDRKEILRYLGYHDNTADSEILQSIEDCIFELEKTAVPRHVFKPVEVTFLEDDLVTVGTAKIKSHDLSQHINSCKQAILFAATLGSQTDYLLQRWSVLSMSRAVVLGACAAAMIEAYCEECEQAFLAEYKEKGLYLRPRYSPGYGDFSIEHQKDMLAELNCAKRIGLTMTDSFMLTPTKSVTAVIGITEQEQTCHVAKCMGCKSINCPFRKGE